MMDASCDGGSYPDRREYWLLEETGADPSEHGERLTIDGRDVPTAHRWRGTA